MMTINAKGMRELAATDCRNEVDNALLNIEATITRRATDGYIDMTFNLQDLRMCAYEMVKDELQKAGFKVDCGQDKRIHVYW